MKKLLLLLSIIGLTFLYSCEKTELENVTIDAEKIVKVDTILICSSTNTMITDFHQGLYVDGYTKPNFQTYFTFGDKLDICVILNREFIQQYRFKNGFNAKDSLTNEIIGFEAYTEAEYKGYIDFTISSLVGKRYNIVSKNAYGVIIEEKEYAIRHYEDIIKYRVERVGPMNMFLMKIIN